MNLVKSFNKISKDMKSKAVSSEIESNGKYVKSDSLEFTQFTNNISFIVKYRSWKKILPINIINILLQISNVNKYIKYLGDEGFRLALFYFLSSNQFSTDVSRWVMMAVKYLSDFYINWNVKQK